MRQLDAQNRSLNRVETEVTADPGVKILAAALRRAVIPQQSQFVREPPVTRRHHTAVAEPAEVLAGKERKASERSHGARGASFVTGSDRLGGVFDDRYASTRGNG